VLLTVLAFAIISSFSVNKNILIENFEPKIFLPARIQTQTKTQFDTKTIQKKQKVPFQVIYQKDHDLDWGKVVKSQSGLTGENLIITETLFWKGAEVNKRTYNKTVKDPVNQINLIGTKLTPGEIDTPLGRLAYRGKMRVFATSYDKNCRGCNETTATGAKLGFGVVAVDPNLIPLGSKIYVEGYGEAKALDTGGAIKGAKIDLAFDDVKAGFWRSRWTEVYLLE